MIVRTSKGWTVKDHTGRSLGTYKTQKEAQERLNQVEMFKNMKSAKNNSGFPPKIKKKT